MKRVHISYHGIQSEPLLVNGTHVCPCSRASFHKGRNRKGERSPAFGPGSPGPRAHPTHSGVTESAPSPVTQREAIHVSRCPEGTEHRAERWPAQRPCCPNGVESWCGVGVGRRLDQGRCLPEGQPVGSLGLLA